MCVCVCVCVYYSSFSCFVLFSFPLTKINYKNKN